MFIAERVEIKPENILFFDDNEINIAGAKTTGMNGILVHSFRDVPEYIKSIEII